MKSKLQKLLVCIFTAAMLMSCRQVEEISSGEIAISLPKVSSTRGSGEMNFTITVLGSDHYDVKTGKSGDTILFSSVPFGVCIVSGVCWIDSVENIYATAQTECNVSGPANSCTLLFKAVDFVLKEFNAEFTGDKVMAGQVPEVKVTEKYSNGLEFEYGFDPDRYTLVPENPIDDGISVGNIKWILSLKSDPEKSCALVVPTYMYGFTSENSQLDWEIIAESETRRISATPNYLGSVAMPKVYIDGNPEKFYDFGNLDSFYVNWTPPDGVLLSGEEKLVRFIEFSSSFEKGTLSAEVVYEGVPEELMAFIMDSKGNKVSDCKIQGAREVVNLDELKSISAVQDTSEKNMIGGTPQVKVKYIFSDGVERIVDFDPSVHKVEMASTPESGLYAIGEVPWVLSLVDNPAVNAPFMVPTYMYDFSDTTEDRLKWELSRQGNESSGYYDYIKVSPVYRYLEGGVLPHVILFGTDYAFDFGDENNFKMTPKGVDEEFDFGSNEYCDSKSMTYVIPHYSGVVGGTVSVKIEYNVPEVMKPYIIRPDGAVSAGCIIEESRFLSFYNGITEIKISTDFEIEFKIVHNASIGEILEDGSCTGYDKYQVVFDGSEIPPSEDEYDFAWYFDGKKYVGHTSSKLEFLNCDPNNPLPPDSPYKLEPGTEVMVIVTDKATGTKYSCSIIKKRIS